MSGSHLSVGIHHRFTGGAEVMLSASGEGGRRGSIALAQPPCGYPPGSAPFTVGAGYASLTGGEVDRESVCPGSFAANVDGYRAMTSFARRATEWSLDGAVAGHTQSNGTVRLIVVDMTRPLAAALH